MANLEQRGLDDERVRLAWIAWHGGRPLTTQRARAADLIDFQRFLSTHTGRILAADPWIVALAIAEIGPHEIVALVAAWHHWMAVQQRAGSTIARRISTVSSWCAILQEHGQPWAIRLSRPKVARYEFRACEWNAVERVIAMLEAASPERVRELVLVLLLVDVGLRRAEACSVRVEHVRLEALSLQVKRKGGQVHVRPLSARAAAAIRLHVGTRKRGPLLTSNRGAPLSESGLAAMTKRLGLDAPHCTRHACAIKLYETTHDAALVGEWLDHSTLSSTQIYVRRLRGLAGKATKILANE